MFTTSKTLDTIYNIQGLAIAKPLQSLEAEMRSLKASAMSQLPFSGTGKLENPQSAPRKRRSTKKKTNPPDELESK